MNKTYGSALSEARSLLRDREIPDADLDAWYLMSEVSGFSRVDFWSESEKEMPDEQVALFSGMVARRAEHEPLQYIIGYQEFCGLRFDVNENVLIPRQDTEVLVEKVLRLSEGRRVLDMCTGSGCIIVSLAVLGQIESGVGADISESALEIARQNAKRHGVLAEVAEDSLEACDSSGKLKFIQSDLFENIDGVFDIIVSNPPYIKSCEIETLMPEVRDHEPVGALDGCDDGLFFYRRIAEDAKEHLCSRGKLIFEIGCEQAKDVSDILSAEGYSDICVFKDLAGLDRVVSCSRP